MDFKLIFAIAFVSIPGIIWIYYLITNFQNKKNFKSALINGLLLIGILALYFCAAEFSK